MRLISMVVLCLASTMWLSCEGSPQTLLTVSNETPAEVIVDVILDGEPVDLSEPIGPGEETGIGTMRSSWPQRVQIVGDSGAILFDEIVGAGDLTSGELTLVVR